MIKYIAAAFLFILPCQAQNNTIVYGASSEAPDKPDAYLVIQPQNAGNPLGNPIINPDQNLSSDSNDSLGQNVPSPSFPAEQTPESVPSASDSNPVQAVDPASQPVAHQIYQQAPQNPEPFSESPEQQQDQIQNTLYQGGNRIYDVQSYPLQDIKTITEPNVQPTITTYPEY